MFLLYLKYNMFLCGEHFKPCGLVSPFPTWKCVGLIWGQGWFSWAGFWHFHATATLSKASFIDLEFSFRAGLGDVCDALLFEFRLHGCEGHLRPQFDIWLKTRNLLRLVFSGWPLQNMNSWPVQGKRKNKPTRARTKADNMSQLSSMTPLTLQLLDLSLYEKCTIMVFSICWLLFKSQNTKKTTSVFMWNLKECGHALEKMGSCCFYQLFISFFKDVIVLLLVDIEM